MSTITVVLGEAPYAKERPYTTLRFCLVALHENHKVNLFLLEDGVFIAKRGQKPPEFPALLDSAMPNCEELMKAVIKAGAKIKACGVCMEERGLQEEEIIKGVEVAGMPNLVKWVSESDKVISF